MTSTTSSPWRAELSALLRLTGPVAAARLGVMAMGLTDALVVGRFSAVELGYQALAWTLPAVAMVGGMGFLSGVQVMTARRLGEGRPQLAGAVLRRGLRYALGLGLGCGLALFLGGPALLQAFHLAPGLAEGSAPALRIFAASLPMILVAACAGLFLESIGRAGTSMAVMWAANLVNLALDLMLVPGAFGLPALGAAGAAWATFGARSVLALALLACIWRLPDAARLGLSGPAHPDAPEAALDQRRLGYGAGVSQLVESAAFSGMNLVAGWIDALAVAGWAVVLNVTALIFMTPLGLSTAAAVRVGRAYGARDEAGVRRAALTAFAAAAAYGLVASVAVSALRHPLAGAYASDPVLVRAAAGALAWCGLFLVPDAVQVVAAQVLRARGDVLAPTVTHVASYAVVMLPLGALLAIPLGLGLAGMVLAVVAASVLSAGLLLARFWMLERRA